MKNVACRSIRLLLVCWVVLFPHFCQAGPNIPGFYGPVVTPPPQAALPVLRPSGTVQGISGFETPSQNQLIIHQDQPNAIIDWSSFNIGADAWTRFDQRNNSSWVALNRIFDRNPSMIFGKLTADGRVYLINQNGILFGPGSKVDVYSLVASALNIKNGDFLNGILNFYVDQGLDYPGLTFDLQAAVSNLGEINAKPGGAVFLIGPRVENAGVINAPAGQIGLAAGTEVNLTADPAGQRTALIVDVKDGFGEAWNREGGQLNSDTGWVGMYGRTVNQYGIIRSVTAITQNGQIELRATEKISTGGNSVMESPISGSTETVDNSFTFSGGKVSMGGLQTIGGDANGVQSVITNPPPALIELRGSIEAPSGQVTMNAGQRVFFETGSLINVGGAWSNEAATANIVAAQLNSVELADAYGQKGGLLQGQKITANALTGSSIGDISGAIFSQQKTALEKGIQGGTIGVTVDAGDIVVKQGAGLDFSGGGIRYSGGLLDTTKLLSGTNIYDIGNAPLSIQYDRIMGAYTKTYDRFGVSESFPGIYYGGASPLKTDMVSFTRGGDAGSLQLAAGSVVLDGQINGSVTQGFFQTNRTLPGSYASTADYQKALQLTQAQGLEIPAAGALTVDTTSSAASAIAVLPDTSPLPTDFSSDGVLSGQQTAISAKTLNAAVLGSLTLFANTKITTGDNARIILSPGGSFTAQASRIEHSGDISVPSGTITLKTVDNKNAQASGITDNEEIFLSPGSRLDVSGERIDNSLVGKVAGASIGSGQIQGGTITIEDWTTSGRGVFIPAGAILDVSGGYRIDAKGKITGGHAGTVEIGGSTLMLNGDLRGYALADTQGKIKGGQIILRSTNIDVTSAPPDWPADFNADSSVPAGLQGRLILAGNRFSDTGFTRIELDSFNNITVDAEVAPSLVKLKTPVPGVAGTNMPPQVHAAGVNVVSGGEGLIRLDDQLAYETGPSVFTAAAGRLFPWQDTSIILPNNSASLTVSPGAVIGMAPEGTITLSAPGAVTMAGTLGATAGKIGIAAGTGGHADLVIKDSGRILANGYNRPDMTSAVQGFGYNYKPRDGGQVTLQASNGNLTLESGSLIDISGSGVFENHELLGGKLTNYSEAGNPGSLALIYSDTLTQGGSVNARAKMAGIQGGSITVNRTGTNGLMNVKAEDIDCYLAAGFDSISLKSGNSLQLSGAMDETVGRQLTIDAPYILGSGQDNIILRSPWITLANTSNLPIGGAISPGDAQLSLHSTGWLDLNGQIDINGFKTVSLNALRDIRLTDWLYTASSPNVPAGQLSAAGDLVIKADRVYPTTFSDYTLQSSGGKLTVLPADTPVGGPIFSAGGNLTVEALNGIEVRGTLAAPTGTITLQGTGPGSRVYLGDGSLVTTAGGAMVNYGSIDDNGAWVVQDKVSGSSNAMSMPNKSVTINAPEVIVQNMATVDVSGGGSIFSYLFQPGIEGTANPLTKVNRYVIMSDRSIQLPGNAIYLNGGGGLSVGIYSLLPAQYAFLPGAVVIEEQNLNAAAGQNLMTKDGFPVVTGYSTVFGTDIRSNAPKAFAVMTASTALSQGNFTVKSQATGDAGDVMIKGNTSIVDGRVLAAALDGYQAGKISLSATDVQLQQTALSLPSGFDFGTVLDPSLQGQSIVAAAGLSGKGFREIDLGDLAVTDNVTIKGGTVLEAPVISLAANKAITVESGAQLKAVTTSGIGEINLNTPAGKAAVQEGALLHASHAINLNAFNQDVQGDLMADHSGLTLKGAEIFFVPAGYARSSSGLYITDSLWSSFSAFDDIKLVSGSDILFMDNFNLSAAGSISIDAARIAGMKAGGTVVSLTAPSIQLSNSGIASSAPSLQNVGQIAFNGDNITVGGGNVLFGGFAAINLNAQKDLTIKGAGSLKTGGADLNLTAARLTNTFDQNQTSPYIPVNFNIDAGSNAFSLNNSGGVPGTPSVAGGMLNISAGKVDISGVMDMSGGTVKITATGSGQHDGIFLHSGGQILARGNDSVPGGRVTLRTENGSLVMEPGSLVDISAGVQGDAGLVALQSPTGGVTLSGNLLATAQGAGIGGSFVLDTNQMQDFSALNEKLATGGFSESSDIRVRSGDVVVPSGTTVRTHHFKLTADSGEINVNGTIDASADAGGGTVEFYAAKDLTVGSNGSVDLRGTSGDSNGGWVMLSSSNGTVNLERGGVIDASGSGAGQGGVIHLRALRDGDYNVKTDLRGTVTGASDLTAEAVRVYDNVSTISEPAMSGWDADNQAFMANAQIIKASLLDNLTRMGGLSVQRVHLRPGIELRNAGDITIGADWDLSTWRYGDEPGVLTIRSGGNLTINANLTDHPSLINNLQGSAGMPSWALNLASGAAIPGADYLSVVRGQGNLTIKDQKLVYTEGAPIRFASGNDTLIGTGVKPAYMINNTISYNLASYSGSILGNVGRDLSISGGAIETATGDIDIGAGRDLILQHGKVSNVDMLGSIRTTGHSTTGQTQYWNYGGGGNITLDVGGKIGARTEEGNYVTALSGRAWDQPYGARQPHTWGASYAQSSSYSPTAGLATMGGGDLVVRAGGDFLSQAGTFGQGDLKIYAGGDISGRFLNRQGRMEILTAGNFGAAGSEQVIEAFDSRINVSAQGNIALGAVVNPTIANDKFAGQFWNLTYTENTSVNLKAGGDVTFTGNSQFYNLATALAENARILPASVDIEAGGDIRLLNSFAIAPSPRGNLRLAAGNDITGSSIYLSDMDPASVYTSSRVVSGNFGDNLFNPYAHADILLHGNDGAPVEVRAGRDINDLMLFLPKKAEITAGRDIRDIYYFGQNVNADDISIVRAGGDVIFDYKPSSNYTGLFQGGPGLLLLQAGNSINLGNSNGVQSIGNQFNSALGTQGSALMVLSGYVGDLAPGDARTFFDELRAEIRSKDSYGQSPFRATDLIPMLGASSGGSGDIDMTVSQISSSSEKGDIFIFAKGALNVGKSTFFSNEASVQNTGILTSGGGAINIFTNGDVNVNESRVMTFLGGDITVWSDTGDINAGRGSKTAINPSAPRKILVGRVGDKDIYVTAFSPPAVGSGIRAVTYDPDGAGPLQAPPPGNIYPHARVLDAGEAGLSGGNIFIQAQQVVNASNISSSSGSIVGMPQATVGVTSIGSLSGAGTVTEGTAQLAQATTGIAASNTPGASQMLEDIMSKWLDVKVIDFVQEE